MNPPKLFICDFVKFFVLILFISGSHPYILAQSDNKVPKVGLVLSGGGALGMAHVGVLKVMEEAGLRPDYITGVSMGSIIGGMYSVGYSADSIYKLLKIMDWDLLFSKSIPENMVVFPEKEHFDNSIISLPVTAKKIKLPSGLINGQQIESQLSFYLWPAAGISDFSKLPIPFMCLAVDILTGKLVELKTGYLPDAIRASMAIPTIFTPVKIDTALLVDGGVLRNFPGEEVRNMGADIIIGSYTGSRSYSEDHLQSMPDIVKQITFLRSTEDYKSQKRNVDIIIEPEFNGFSRTQFANVDSIVEIGYKEALQYKGYFKKLADSINHMEIHKPIENILGREVFSFEKIEIVGNKIYSDDQILGFLGIEPGEEIGKNRINEKIDLIYGKRWFEKVKYRILSRNDSLILVIDCIEEPRIMLYGSVYYDNYIRSGIVFRMTFKDLMTRKSFIDFDSYIGQFYRARLTFLQYLDRNQKFGFRTVFYADNTRLPMITINNESGPMFNHSFYTGISLSKYLGLNHLMNVAVILGSSRFIPDYVSPNDLQKISFNFLSGAYNYQVNTIDTKYFPNTGTLFQLTAGTSKLLSGSLITESSNETYKETSPGEFFFNRTFSISAGFRQYFTPGKKVTFSFKGNFHVSYGSDSVTSLHDQYYLGGIESLTPRSIPLTGFQSNEIAVDNFAGAGADFDFEVIKNVHLTLMADIYGANVIPENEKTSLLGGFGLLVGYMSVIGPLKIGIMNGLSSIHKYSNVINGYISLGYRF
jgi:NTE family protein